MHETHAVAILLERQTKDIIKRFVCFATLGNLPNDLIVCILLEREGRGGRSLRGQEAGVKMVRRSNLRLCDELELTVTFHDRSMPPNRVLLRPIKLCKGRTDEGEKENRKNQQPSHNQ